MEADPEFAEEFAADEPYELTPGDVFAADPRFIASASARTFDLYAETDGRVVLFRRGDQPFTAADAAVVAARGNRPLYILSSEREKYLRHVEQSMLSILLDPAIPIAARASVLWEMSVTVIGDFVKNPDSKNSMVRSRTLVDGISGFLRHAPQALHNMFLHRNMDPDMASRAVNCCVFAIGLTARVGIVDGEQVQAVALGCLLKDVGMQLIPERVVNKPAPLSPEEWMIVKRHPELSLRLVERAGPAHPIVREAIMQHHERLDGSGYPNHLVGDHIGLYGRIAAVVDVFDALTTDRPHAKALESYLALQLMKEEVSRRLDDDVFRELVLLLGG